MKYLKNKKFKFGKYKDQPFSAAREDVNYLRWLYDKDIARGQLRLYIQIVLNLPRSQFSVSVEESTTVPDSTYIVGAYTKSHAISIAKHKYNIHDSQSGTTYSAKKL